MSQIEIQYLIPKAVESQADDVSAILNATGAYQNEARFHIDQTAEVDTGAHESVMIRLIRRSLSPQYDHDLLEIGERMREGVEAHFPEADRERLSRLFIGVKPTDAIEVEKP